MAFGAEVDFLTECGMPITLKYKQGDILMLKGMSVTQLSCIGKVGRDYTQKYGSSGKLVGKNTEDWH